MKNKKIVMFFLLVIVILVIGLILFKSSMKVEQTNGSGEEILTKEESSKNTFSLFDSIKNEIITAENYEDIMNRIGNELKDEDEAYYFTYACLYYIAKDGMATAFSNPDDTEAMYARVYGKTVEQLIDEGKQLMQENDMTVERYKQSFQNLAEN